MLEHQQSVSRLCPMRVSTRCISLCWSSPWVQCVSALGSLVCAGAVLGSNALTKCLMLCWSSPWVQCAYEMPYSVLEQSLGLMCLRNAVFRAGAVLLVTGRKRTSTTATAGPTAATPPPVRHARTVRLFIISRVSAWRGIQGNVFQYGTVPSTVSKV